MSIKSLHRFFRFFEMQFFGPFHEKNQMKIQMKQEIFFKIYIS